MLAYYGSKISPNMTRTPEGYLICLNVPIARTGRQEYLRSELGILDDEPNAIVDVIRDEKEVFSPATIASFEGKPVCEDHPPVGVDASNITAYDKGHVQNVRRGSGDESDLLIADLYITSPQLIEAIGHGLREVSCGYECDYEQDKDGNIYQSRIRGNHVAIVSAGRAGSRVAIKDSSAQKRAEGSRKTMGKRDNKWLARMFSHAVKDMEPEEIADTIEAMRNEPANTGDDGELENTAPVAKDNGGGDVLAQLAAAVAALSAKVDAICAEKAADEEIPAAALDEGEKPSPVVNPAAIDEGGDPLAKLADEIAAEAGDANETETQMDEETALTIPADEMPDDVTDEDGPVAEGGTLPENPIRGADRAVALYAINAIKPVIATLPPKQRKAASDKAAREIRKMLGRDSKPRVNGYAALQNAIRQGAKSKARDSKPKYDNGDIGRAIMASRNPHYANKG